MEKVKRDRGNNFTLLERDILVSVIEKYKAVLENKQSDTSTWKMKENAWESIQDEFNARSGGTFRSAKALKIKYEGLKRMVRKKPALVRLELYRTGGGRNTATPLDNVEEKIKGMITLSTDGLESVYDSDTLPINEESLELTKDCEPSPPRTSAEVGETSKIEPLPPTTSAEVGETNEIFPDMLDEHTVTPSTLSSKKWDSTSRKNLKTRKHPALIAKIPKKSLFDELTQVKIELVQLQKEFLKAEIAEKRKAWEFEENERKWKEEEYKLKLQEYKLKLQQF